MALFVSTLNGFRSLGILSNPQGSPAKSHRTVVIGQDYRVEVTYQDGSRSYHPFSNDREGREEMDEFIDNLYK